MSNAVAAQSFSLDGQVVLIVQRNWLIANALAIAFEVKGARTLLSRAPAEADLANLCAAVLDSDNPALCQQLEARSIPYVMYTTRRKVADECAGAPIVEKPASAAEVVHRVEELLRAAK